MHMGRLSCKVVPAGKNGKHESERVKQAREKAKQVRERAKQKGNHDYSIIENNIKLY